MSESRNGAPLYGLFEVTFLEDINDPVDVFRAQLNRMLSDIEKPILDELIHMQRTI